MKPGPLLLLLTIFGGLAGCAGLEVTPIPPGEAGKTEDEKATGFRYYETSPFLLIYTDGKGGLVSKLLYLPDMTKKRSIRPYAYLSSNNTTLKFENGTLVEAKAIIDETVIPTSVISGLAKVAIAGASANAPDKTTPTDSLPGAYLYRIVQTNDTWTLVGNQSTRIMYLPKDKQ
ncbi:hypothetical protein [Undibacterium terreum]|uniref:Lipoprotein n=1 Tax=Undibacterium terreum TaxID=1224302 RepID=A0A916UXN7_9BURK|nr:hypothetical protein [Undibacterium terreum]GGC93423.1 hypothetical protein GCM10011396_45880 [Undibacterium terreum]